MPAGASAELGTAWKPAQPGEEARERMEGKA